MIKRQSYVFFLFAMLFSISSWASVGSLLLVTGEVNIVRADQTIPAQIGAELFEKDKVLTQTGGRAQLRFSDDTVITLGANTEFGIEAFLNEGANRSKAEFSVAKGTFKAITGRVGKVAPDNFKLQTKTATIGIRGTIFSGNIQADRELIATLRGRIRVTDRLSGLSVEVPAGFATRIIPGEPPQPPQPLSADELDEMNSAGNDEQGGSGDNNSSDNGGDPDQNSADTPPPPQSSQTSTPLPLLSEPDTNQILGNLQDDNLLSQIEQNSSLEVFGWKPYSELRWDQEPGEGEPVFASDGAETFTVTAENLIGTFDNYIGWGLWQENYEGEPYIGYWVGGTEVVSAAAHIESLIETSASYSYTGQVMGQVDVYDTLNGTYALYDVNTSTSSVLLNFNFNDMQNPVSGHMNFSAGAGGDWNLDVGSGWIGSGDTAGQFDLSLASQDEQQFGYANGRFFGPQAQSVGGVFDIMNYEQDKYASGVFKATR